MIDLKKFIFWRDVEFSNKNEYELQMLNICLYHVPYCRVTSLSRLLVTEYQKRYGVLPEIKWCEENLNGQFYEIIEKEMKTGRKEWVMCFEFEEDAMAFKLRWI